MTRALWKGSIAFGLVGIPVELHTAVRDSRPRFRLLHAEDRSPVRFERVCAREGKAVAWDELVKGYEYEKGRFVVVTKEDFQAAALEKTRTIDIRNFVKGGEIDDRFFEMSYYLVPPKGGARAYALLREAMRATGLVGIATIVLRDAQHLAALEMARTLVENLADRWDPTQYSDQYRENLMPFIRARMKGKEPKLVETVEPQQAEVVDLMERLRRSLEAAGGAGRKPARARRTTHKAKRKRAA